MKPRMVLLTPDKTDTGIPFHHLFWIGELVASFPNRKLVRKQKKSMVLLRSNSQIRRSGLLCKMKSDIV